LAVDPYQFLPAIILEIRLHKYYLKDAVGFSGGVESSGHVLTLGEWSASPFLPDECGGGLAFEVGDEVEAAHVGVRGAVRVVDAVEQEIFVLVDEVVALLIDEVVVVLQRLDFAFDHLDQHLLPHGVGLGVVLPERLLETGSESWEGFACELQGGEEIAVDDLVGVLEVQIL
jgi:predicted NBD/HSP70 family sugar kinase